jgi:hypothetical protein
MKTKLLPFQLEGLFWMRKQEKTIWNGGMLAVRKLSLSLMPPNILLLWLGRDGVRPFSPSQKLS